MQLPEEFQDEYIFPHGIDVHYGTLTGGGSDDGGPVVLLIFTGHYKKTPDEMQEFKIFMHEHEYINFLEDAVRDLVIAMKQRAVS